MQAIINKSHKVIIGKFALAFLQQSPHAVVWGNTSNGIFLQVEDSKIVFLTPKPHFGPVNIILNQGVPLSWKNGDTFQLIVEDKKILFKNKNDLFEISFDEVWQTDKKPINNISKTDQQYRLSQSVKQLSLLKNGQGYSRLLIPIFSNDLTFKIEDQWLQKSWVNVLKLKEGLLQKDLSSLHDVAFKITGSGRGLTPSGDDLLMGLFFMKNRWFEKLEWITPLEPDLLDRYKQQTTAVSATLFECALHAQADARIQEMSDVLMNADIPFNQQAINLARWGNSSGADVFLGMLLAIQCFQSE